MRQYLSSSGDGEVPQTGLTFPPHQGLHASLPPPAPFLHIYCVSLIGLLMLFHKRQGFKLNSALVQFDSRESQFQGELSNSRASLAGT